jgi:multisubunit Na+/H+ antiporter MnhC subunit
MCTGDRLGSRWIVGAFIVVLILLASVCEGSAQPRSGVQTLLAYLDPTVGSLILQGLIAAFAAVAVALRLYWDKIKRLLGFPPARAEKGSTERKPASDE